jgi:hypothetical protein
MKKKHLLMLYDGICSLNTKANGEFGYILAKNRSLIEDEITALKQANQPSERFAEYQRLLSVSETVDDSKHLQDMFSDAITERKKQVEQINKLLDEEVQIDFIKIKRSDIPKDATHIQSLFPIIEE